jgi:hypothetical protein
MLHPNLWQECDEGEAGQAPCQLYELVWGQPGHLSS